jgi:uncharacterized protein (TIGR02271 family)
MDKHDAARELGRLPLVEEVVRLGRRRRVTGRVRVSVATAEAPAEIPATQETRVVEIAHVPLGHEVEAPPPVRQEGDTVVIPVLEERLVVVRRLVLREEIHLRLRTQAQAVTLTATLRRQQAQVERLPPEPGDIPFMTRTLTALFDSRAQAERAAEALRGLNVRAQQVQVHDDAAAGAWPGGIALPDDDMAAYHEGMRRGGAVVTAEVEENGLDLAMDALEAAGAVDLDTREAEWRSAGWTGGITGSSTPDGTPGNPPGTMASRAVDKAAGTNISGAHPENERARMARTDTDARTSATGAAMGATGREEVIPIAEERLRVGKRQAHGGRVRVRSYVVETPVEEQVRLREERVHVTRHATDRPVGAGDADLFRDRVIEAEESIEEAVVSKEARVTGEVVVNKDATERTETIRDTVRRTEVEVDEDAAANDPKRRPGKGAA